MEFGWIIYEGYSIQSNGHFLDQPRLANTDGISCVFYLRIRRLKIYELLEQGVALVVLEAKENRSGQS